MKTLLEDNWNSWNPSAHDKGDPNSQAAPPLLEADNLFLEDAGIVRTIRPSKVEATTAFSGSDINSLFSTILAGIKTRFVYITSGGNKIIECTSTDPTSFDTTLVTQAETAKYCSFLTAMGRVIMCAGGIQRKYDGTHNFTLGIAAPSAPTLAAQTTYSIDLNNLDGSSHYTNWTAILDASFSNSGTNITGTGTPVASSLANNLSFETVFSSVKDTTNLNGTGKDTPDDIFQFTIEVDDITQLAWVNIQLMMETPPVANNYFWKEWDFQTGITDPTNPYAPFPIVSGVDTVVTLKRSDWFSVGNPDWSKVKAIIVTIGITDTSSITWSGFKVFGGTESILTGDFNYIIAWADNASGWYEFSPGSSPAAVTALYNQSVLITAPGAAPANANEYWIFRQDTDGGVYLRVATLTGAYGFSPGTYLDFRTLDDLFIDANINPLYNLYYFRTALPTTIKDMIWFRDRVIYLDSLGFIPSFKLDPGSYDSRFRYELVGSNNELPLFIAKLDVGTFIVATSADFYRVTGTFNIILDPNDPTGQTYIQDVTITPLGVKNPAISHAWVEYQGTIIYVANDGIRILSNATSTLINDNLELLFRGEARGGVPAISLLPRDASLIAMCSIGQRIYISLPHTDTYNRVYVLTIANQNTYLQVNTRSWRVITNSQALSTNPISLFREEDGTIIYGSLAASTNKVSSLESDQTLATDLYIKFLTQFNYNQSPLSRKDILAFRAKISTNAQSLTLIVHGLGTDSTVYSKTVSINATGDTLIDLDLKDAIPPCLAYSVEIYGATKFFSIQWFSIDYEERPHGIRRAIVFAEQFDSAGRKRIAQWPFVANCLGTSSPATITANLMADNVALTTQTFTGAVNIDAPQTFKWQCDPTQDILARDWQFELTSNKEFELHKFLPPIIIQKTPELTLQQILPANNFGTKARKIMGNLGFRANLLSSIVTATLRVDGVAKPTQTFTGGDFIDTYVFEVVNDTKGVDWELELNITSGSGMEFYEFLEPNIIEKFPEITLEAIFPANNFGIPGRKRVGAWAFRANLRSSTVSVTVLADNVSLPVQNLTAGDIIETFNFIPPNDILATDWAMFIRVTAGSGIEFYEFINPDITQQCPEPIKQAIIPTTNYDSSSRKRVGTYPFLVNLRNQTCTIKCRVDGIDQTPVNMSPNGTDEIQTIDYIPPNLLTGVDWQVKVECAAGMEFYKFLNPVVSQPFPAKTKYAIHPGTNFGKAGPKEVTVWPFIATGFGHNLVAIVTVDGSVEGSTIIPTEGDFVQTCHWRNTRNLRGVDWMMEVYPQDAANEMEFYKFMGPELLQVFPVAKLIDQIGPLDLNKQAIIYGVRFRIMGSTPNQVISYSVCDADNGIFADDFIVSMEDDVYQIKFPKGVNAATFTLNLTSVQIFYRFSVEVKIRITGNETDEKYVMIKDVNVQ